jgi:ribosome-associated protein
VSEPADWAVEAARAADDKGAIDVVVLEVGEVSPFARRFVICSGRSSRSVRAIADAVRERLRELDAPPPSSVEGLDEAEWVLVGYPEVVIHVFSEQARSFYDLERLWRDVPRVEWS